MKPINAAATCLLATMNPSCGTEPEVSEPSSALEGECVDLDLLNRVGFGHSTATDTYDRRVRGLDEDRRNAVTLVFLDREFQEQCFDQDWAQLAEDYLWTLPASDRFVEIQCRAAVCRVEISNAVSDLGIVTLPEDCGSGSTSYVRLRTANNTVGFISRCGFSFSSRDDHISDWTLLETPFPS